MSSLMAAAQKLQEVAHVAARGLVGREALAELLVVSAVAQEHLLVIGPPGTGKSAVVRRFSQCLGGSYFEYVLGRFTEPAELFGTVNLQRLREGFVETDTHGMLPEAQVAFLDEVFLGSSAVLNTLLGILNERQFRRGHTRMQCPLKLCVAASNALPDDEALAAFADRFLLQTHVGPVAEHELEVLLQAGRSLEGEVEPVEGAWAALELLAKATRHVRMDVVTPPLVQALKQLRAAKLGISDRRAVKMQKLVAASAVLGGRLEALSSDLWPILYAVPGQAAQAQARELLAPLLGEAVHRHLMGVVEEAAQRPLSRSARLLAQSQALLAQEGEDVQPQIEALLREIDSNFAQGQLPPELAQARSALVDRLIRVD